jgi:hypothetical protein
MHVYVVCAEVPRSYIISVTLQRSKNRRQSVETPNGDLSGGELYGVQTQRNYAEATELGGHVL